MADLDDFLEELKNAFKNCVTLQIMTAVAEVTTNAEGVGIDWSGKPAVALTKIDLLQGDITTVFNEAFVTGSYDELRAFHKEREAQGQQIIKGNVEALKELVDTVSDLVRGGT